MNTPNSVYRGTGTWLASGRPAPPRRERWSIASSKTEVVWASAGDEHSIFATSASQLVSLTRGELVDVAVTVGGVDV